MFWRKTKVIKEELIVISKENRTRQEQEGDKGSARKTLGKNQERTRSLQETVVLIYFFYEIRSFMLRIRPTVIVKTIILGLFLV